MKKKCVKRIRTQEFDEQNSDNEDQNQSNKKSRHDSSDYVENIQKKLIKSYEDQIVQLKTQINDYNNNTNSFLNNNALIKELALKITQLEEKERKINNLTYAVSKLERENSTLLESLMEMEYDNEESNHVTDNEQDGEHDEKEDKPGACERRPNGSAYSSFIS
ncbi:hypothetical protein F8M41_017743 [Gigaspora margarita]|uniref:Uncharacterized protein n=1 Tax=Gigaspora margarita TaxID=4874 RepID=A0A8H4AMN6_GIGMA|nr:hypothetical protein F8M41_017743 [Gigaspora margarita]